MRADEGGEFCKRCGRITPTILLPLSSGHIGRVCAVCRCCRSGRPYATKREFLETAERPMAPRAMSCNPPNTDS